MTATKRQRLTTNQRAVLTVVDFADRISDLRVSVETGIAWPQAKRTIDSLLKRRLIVRGKDDWLYPSGVR